MKFQPLVQNRPSSQDLTGLARGALQRTARWIDRFGGRLAGSPACLQTARALVYELEQAGAVVALEPFVTRPKTFTRFYRIDILLYVIGVTLLFFGLPLLAGLVLTFMIVGAGLQFGYYIELYDRFYPQQECWNVSAVLQPRLDATRQLILSGHHDSAQELNFLKGNQKLYGLKIIVPDAVRMLAALTAWIWVIWQAASGQPPVFLPQLKIVLVLGFFFVFSKFNLFGPQPTPGAGDNLIASSLLVDLANRFRAPGLPGQSILEHTRLILVSFDAEEAGLRGSRAWVKAHQDELEALPTTALNIDSIYTLRDLQFLVSDLNSHVQLDHKLAERCRQIALKRGYPAALAKMRFGGGGTDAAELAKAGVSATTLIAMSASLVRDGLVYHTLQDTVDAIEPAAVEACLAVAEELAFELDSAI